MAYFNLEDLAGNVEVVVFPKPFLDYRKDITEDNKVFIIGNVDLREDENGKLLCNKVIPFDSVPRECWIKFPDKQAYIDVEKQLFTILQSSDGNDRVIVYCEAEKAKKILPPSMTIKAEAEVLSRLKGVFGEKNVKVVEKSIEK